MTKPCRGEIWFVEFDPVKGGEIGKTRPAIVISIDGVGRLPLKTVVPITDWKAHYDQFPWFVCIKPSGTNGLTKLSGADAFQIKSVSETRFKSRVGVITKTEIEDVVSAAALCIGV